MAIGKLFIGLGLDHAQLRVDAEKAYRHVNRFSVRANRAMKKLRRGIGRAAGSLKSFGGIAAGVSVAGFAAMIAKTVEAQDQISKLSTRLGVSSEALSEYRFIAERSGVEFNTLTKAFQNMSRQIADANMGTGEAVDALRQLNLSASDLNRLAPEQQFEEIAKALNQISNQSDRINIASDLFGSRGVSLLQITQGGVQGLRDLQKQAKAFGVSLSKDVTDQAARTADALTNFKAAMAGIANAIAYQLGPHIEDLVDWMAVNLPRAIEDSIQVFQELGTVAGKVFRFLGLLEEEETIRLEKLTAQYVENERAIDRWGQARGPASAGARSQIASLTAENEVLEQQIKKISAVIKRRKDMEMAIDRSVNRRSVQTLSISSGQIERPSAGPATDEIASRLDTIREGFKSELQIAEEAFADRQKIISDAFKVGEILDEEHKQLLLTSEKVHQESLQKILRDGLTTDTGLISSEMIKRESVIDEAFQKRLIDDEKRKALLLESDKQARKSALDLLYSGLSQETQFIAQEMEKRRAMVDAHGQSNLTLMQNQKSLLLTNEDSYQASMLEKVKNGLSAEAGVVSEEMIKRKSIIDADGQAKLASMKEQKNLFLSAQQSYQTSLLDMIKNGMLAESGIMNEELIKRKELADEAFENKLITLEERNAVIFAAEKQHEESITKLLSDEHQKRLRFEKATGVEKANIISKDALKLTAGVTQQNKKMFQINKAAAIAQAALAMPEHVAKTFAAYSWPWSYIMGGLAAAASLAQIKAIKSTSFGGGGASAPSIPGGAGSIPAINNAPIDLPSNNQPAEPQRPTNVYITMNGAGFSDEAVRELMESINEQIGDGVNLVTI